MSDIKYLDGIGVQSIIDETKNRLNGKQNILMPGNNISITIDENTGETIISANGGGTANIATSSTVGTVKPDNSTITVDENGIISANMNIDVLSSDPANPTTGQIWVTTAS